MGNWRNTIGAAVVGAALLASCGSDVDDGTTAAPDPEATDEAAAEIDPERLQLRLRDFPPEWVQENPGDEDFSLRFFGDECLLPAEDEAVAVATGTWPGTFRRFTSGDGGSFVVSATMVAPDDDTASEALRSFRNQWDVCSAKEDPPMTITEGSYPDFGDESISLRAEFNYSAQMDAILMREGRTISVFTYGAVAGPVDTAVVETYASVLDERN